MFRDRVTREIQNAWEMVRESIGAMEKVDEAELAQEDIDALTRATRRRLRYAALLIIHALNDDEREEKFREETAGLIGNGHFCD